MEAQASLIGAEGRVDLSAKAAIDLDLPFVVDPGNAEDDLSFRLANPFDQSVFDIVQMLGDHGTETFQNLIDGLMKFRLACISSQDILKNRQKFLIDSRKLRFLLFL